MRLSSQIVNEPRALSEALYCAQFVVLYRFLAAVWLMSRAYKLFSERLCNNALPNYALLVPRSNAAEDSTCAINLCDMIHTVLDGEKFGAAPFISAIISSASGYFSAMRGEMTMP